METPAARIREHEAIFRNIIRDLKANDRGIVVPDVINPDASLDELTFACCAHPRTRFFSITDFNLGPKRKETEQIAQNEAYIDAMQIVNQTHSKGATLIYEIGPNGEVGYTREYNRWEKP